MRFPIELLVLACLVVGILPAITIGPILDVGVRALLGAEAPAYNPVWHGFTVPLVMSLIALAGGALLYVLLQGFRDAGSKIPLFPPVDGRRIFDRVLVALGAGRAASMRSRREAAAAAALGHRRRAARLWPVWQRGLQWGPLPSSEIHPALALAWAVGAVCASAPRGRRSSIGWSR